MMLDISLLFDLIDSCRAADASDKAGTGVATMSVEARQRMGVPVKSNGKTTRVSAYGA